MMFPVLIDSQTLQSRIQEMAGGLRQSIRFPSQAPAPAPGQGQGQRQGETVCEEPLLLSVLEGALPFSRQLCRLLGRGVESFDRIKLSSYGDGTVSQGRVEVVRDMQEDPRGRRVVILEDIVDTGRTLAFLRKRLLERGAASVEIYTLLDKPSRRVVEVPLTSVGFEIPDQFVLGFGLDVAGKYRDLPYIGIFEESVAARELEEG